MYPIHRTPPKHRTYRMSKRLLRTSLSVLVAAALCVTSSLALVGRGWTVHAAQDDSARILSNAQELSDFLTECQTPGAARTQQVVLGADILMTSHSQPIGAVFSGRLDGAGYTITGLTGPLFRLLDGAEVTHLRLRGDSTADLGGLLAGEVSGSTITSCAASGRVTGQQAAGGLVGVVNEDGTLLANCSAEADVSAATCAGGLVGEIRGSGNQMINCAATGDVRAEDSQAGGLIGAMPWNNDISNSYARGEVQARLLAGGFVGCVDTPSSPAALEAFPDGRIANCCSMGTVQVPVDGQWYGLFAGNFMVKRLRAECRNNFYDTRAQLIAGQTEQPLRATSEISDETIGIYGLPYGDDEGLLMEALNLYRDAFLSSTSPAGLAWSMNDAYAPELTGLFSIRLDAQEVAAKISDLPDPVTTRTQADAVARASAAFAELSPAQQNTLEEALLTRLEQAQVQAGTVNHVDGDVSISGEQLPWYVRLEAELVDPDSSIFSDHAVVLDDGLLYLYRLRYVDSILSVSAPHRSNIANRIRIHITIANIHLSMSKSGCAVLFHSLPMSGHSAVHNGMVTLEGTSDDEYIGITRPAELGDIDGDRVITALDALIVLKYSVHALSLNTLEQRLGEVDGAGKITSVDALYILRHSTHTIDTFPIAVEE